MPLFSARLRFVRTGPSLAVLGVVVAGLGFPAPAWGDEQLDRKIEQAARSSYNFRAVIDRSVEVKAEDGVVSLRGIVRDPQQKALAESTVRELPGVLSVKNELEAAAPLHERADGWIALKIRSLLFLRPEVSGRHTDIEVHDGVVTLSGVAVNATQRDLTEALARGVQGVRDVRNELRVGHSAVRDPGRAGPEPEQPLAAAPAAGERATEAPPVDDALLAVRVKHTLVEEGLGEAERTQVESKDGAVVIRGLVRSEREKSRVSRLAGSVPGVAAVSNEMSIGAAE